VAAARSAQAAAEAAQAAAVAAQAAAEAAWVAARAAQQAANTRSEQAPEQAAARGDGASVACPIALRRLRSALAQSLTSPPAARSGDALLRRSGLSTSNGNCWAALRALVAVYHPDSDVGGVDWRDTRSSPQVLLESWCERGSGQIPTLVMDLQRPAATLVNFLSAYLRGNAELRRRYASQLLRDAAALVPLRCS